MLFFAPSHPHPIPRPNPPTPNLTPNLTPTPHPNPPSHPSLVPLDPELAAEQAEAQQIGEDGTLPQVLLRKYITYAKQHCRPQLTAVGVVRRAAPRLLVCAILCPVGRSRPCTA